MKWEREWKRERESRGGEMGLLQWLLASKLTPEPSVTECMCVFVDECIQAFWGMSGQSLLTDYVCSCGLTRLWCVWVCVCVCGAGGGGGSYTWPYEKIAFILKQFCLDKWLFVCLNIPFHKRSSLFRFVVSLAQREPDNSWPCLLSGLIVNNDVCHSKESYILFIFLSILKMHFIYHHPSVCLSVCRSVGHHFIFV